MDGALDNLYMDCGCKRALLELGAGLRQRRGCCGRAAARRGWVPPLGLLLGREVECSTCSWRWRRTQLAGGCLLRPAAGQGRGPRVQTAPPGWLSMGAGDCGGRATQPGCRRRAAVHAGAARLRAGAGRRRLPTPAASQRRVGPCWRRCGTWRPAAQTCAPGWWLAAPPRRWWPRCMQGLPGGLRVTAMSGELAPRCALSVLCCASACVSLRPQGPGEGLTVRDSALLVPSSAPTGLVGSAAV
jgi:hypothetical protein